MIQTLCLNLSAKRQARRIRLLYFKAITRQDVSWFENQGSGSLINSLTDKIYNIEEGIGTKLGRLIQNLSGFVTGILIGFIVDWRLALVASALLPLVVCAFGSFGIIHKYFLTKELDAYSKASSISAESLSAIRTVFAFGGEKKELDRYKNELKTAERMGIKKSIAFGGVTGLIGFTMFVSAALVFWYGIRRIINQDSSPGNVVTVFVNIIFGSILLGTAFTNIPSVMSAIVSAKTVYNTIERIPPIDKNAGGKEVPNFSGNIRFNNVSFSYPSRPETKVLENFSLDLCPGQTVALVGPSGSGKSTVIHMIQRFYDPIEGQIFVDGVDIRELNIKDFRRRLGCVQQEPVLFEGTVEENIRLGNLDATQDEVVEAAKVANAHQFITELPDGYNTLIGESGGGLSGGQKQRIAIARALLRKPDLLLLDEATSALDTRSERIVQAALEKASCGRTVIVVAHRLTTVRHADVIIFLDKGRICETGTHEQLMALDGLYAAMVKNQMDNTKTARDSDSDSDDGNEVEHTIGATGDIEPSKTIEHEQTSKDQSGKDVASSELSLCSSTRRKSSDLTEKNATAWVRFKNSPVMRLIAINRPELLYLLGGCLCSTLAGACQPIFAILYSEVYHIFTLIDNPDEMQHRINVISASMAGVGAARLLIGLGQGYLFGISGERLIKRMRSTVFETILKQEVGWFDKSENQAGALTALLATEASKLSQITGTRLGTLCEVIMLITISLTVAFYYSWQISLLTLAFFPFLVVAGFIQMHLLSDKRNEFQDNKAVKIAQEAIRSERTVTSFSLENYFCKLFEQSTDAYMRAQIKQSMIFALVYSLSVVIPTLSFSATFSLGAHLMEKGVIDMISLFRVFIIFSIGSQGLGHAASAAPDAKEAVTGATKMLAIIDRVPQIITNVGEIPQAPFKGHIQFKNVHFRYPTRPGVRVLKNFSHTVKPGQTVALVGQSGCGKSTLIQLLQRFYDPSHRCTDSSGIYFDGRNLRDLAPSWIRQQIGLVSQEPTLFNVTIRENIAYGDNTRELEMEEIVAAARLANIHDFIASLPNGYDTLTGECGSQLSGGQKQRIAIARALVRKPVLLLLDEATSALDNESERVVQAALDAACVSRTSIVVAHRLTTVENSDVIVVIENGKKIEEGSPAALMQAQGAFYALHHAEAETK